MNKLKPCPFCNGIVRIVICDDEGNYPKSPDYEDDPCSGLGYLLCHSTEDANGECPIAGHPGEDNLGITIYDTIEEATNAWNKRV